MPAAVPPPASSPSTRRAPRAVLLIEDEPSIGNLVQTYFERDSFTVIWLRSGEEALYELAGRKIDLVVLDIGLPGIDGFEVCRRIRARSQTPILTLTARDEEPDRITGFELGADDYVLKPFSPRELVARANAILRRGGRKPTELHRLIAWGKTDRCILPHVFRGRPSQSEARNRRLYPGAVNNIRPDVLSGRGILTASTRYRNGAFTGIFY